LLLRLRRELVELVDDVLDLVVEERTSLGEREVRDLEPSERELRPSSDLVLDDRDF
jgi:hypothetical protein